jgi:hypothetical protein
MNPPGIHGAESPHWDEPTVELPVVAPVLHALPVRRLLFGGMAAAVLLLGGLVVASVGAGPPAASRPVPGVTGTAAAVRERASLELVGDASVVTVRTADLGGELFRVSPPARSADDDGSGVRLALDGGGGPVDVVLAERVRWDLRIAGGADRKRIDLAGGLVDGVALTGGAGRIELLLPRPRGTLAVRLSGGVGAFDVRTAGAVPVRVRMGSGAGRVVLGGESHTGVAAGALFTPDRWADAGDRVDLDAAAGVDQLTVSAT